ncbi:hypothetical protein [Motiliproteus sp. SC1-56]|uniref:hypothetical protein n=1 Tax=Motiliproteus sp. SC1-56 TaxID=2799565 RepID=UPI001A8FA504|nr:hypothetical protein [Motiliproteus sp. SC1-56]
MIKANDVHSAEQRLSEEQLYDFVAEELAQGEKRTGLWLKALENSEGIEDRAKALYIKYRVQSLKDEILVAAGEKAEQTKKKTAEKPPKGDGAGQVVAEVLGVSAWLILPLLIIASLIY